MTILTMIENIASPEVPSWVDYIDYPARARNARARRACALRALGLLLADGTPTVGGRLFEPSAKFFYGNSCNSGTESRKIVSKVGN